MMTVPRRMVRLKRMLDYRGVRVHWLHHTRHYHSSSTIAVEHLLGHLVSLLVMSALSFVCVLSPETTLLAKTKIQNKEEKSLKSSSQCWKRLVSFVFLLTGKACLQRLVKGPIDCFL